MNDLCALRIVGASSIDEAYLVANRSSLELCSDYRSGDFGIDVVRSIRSDHFLSIYLGKVMTIEETIIWLEQNNLETICENFNEDYIDDERKMEEIGILFGEDFGSCFYINKIDVSEDKTLFTLHFDICPIHSLWDYVSFIYPSLESLESLEPLDEKQFSMSSFLSMPPELDFQHLEYGKTKNLSSKGKHRGFAHVLVLNMKNEKDEFGRLIPVYDEQNYQRKNYTTIEDSIKKIPEEEDDYTIYLYSHY